MKIRPLGDRILVKREEAAETVSGGIIIPDSAKEKPQEGKVIVKAVSTKTVNTKQWKSKKATASLWANMPVPK